MKRSYKSGLMVATIVGTLLAGTAPAFAKGFGGSYTSLGASVGSSLSITVNDSNKTSSKTGGSPGGTLGSGTNGSKGSAKTTGGGSTTMSNSSSSGGGAARPGRTSTSVNGGGSGGSGKGSAGSGSSNNAGSGADAGGARQAGLPDAGPVTTVSIIPPPPPPVGDTRQVISVLNDGSKVIKVSDTTGAWKLEIIPPNSPTVDAEYTVSWQVTEYFVTLDANGNVTSKSFVTNFSAPGATATASISFSRAGHFVVVFVPVSNKGRVNWDGNTQTFLVAVPDSLVGKPIKVPQPETTAIDPTPYISGGGGKYDPYHNTDHGNNMHRGDRGKSTQAPGHNK